MWNEKGTKCTYNFPSDNKVNNFHIIIDDDSDMLPEQIGHFINTDTVIGFTLNEFNRFEEIFMRDNGRGGSFPERKDKDYRE